MAAPLFTALSMGALLSHEVEWGATGIALVLAVLAAVSGVRVHGAKVPAVVLIASGVALVGARTLEYWELHSLGIAFGSASGLGLVCGHVFNRKALSSCTCGTQG